VIGFFIFEARNVNYFKEPRSLIATREGDGYMKDTDHHMRHRRGHLGRAVIAVLHNGCRAQIAGLLAIQLDVILQRPQSQPMSLLTDRRASAYPPV
jgi:hypothetical protein